MTLGAKFTIRDLPHFASTRVDPGLEKGAAGWRGVKGWPGYRVNAINRDLFVDGLTRAGKPTRVDSQPGAYKGGQSVIQVDVLLHML
jgi:hypothetical protein